MVQYFRAGSVFTGVSEDDRAEAFAVEDGRFVWVGRADQLPADARVTDLGDLVIPGLLDVHTHAGYVARLIDSVACLPPVVTDIDSLVAALRGHNNAGKSGWIEGWGYDESLLAEGRTPTRHDLDRVSTTQPVYVQRSDCHSGICNSVALALAGITRDTPDPDDGFFGRDADGEPNGVLVEHDANQRVYALMVGDGGFDADLRHLVASNDHFLQRGLVGITDMMGKPTGYDLRELFDRAAAQGFTPRVRYYLGLDYLDAQGCDRLEADPPTRRVGLGGIKLFGDGSMSNKTAWMRDPYRGGGVGMQMLTDADCLRALELARSGGVQIAVHAMGDAAINQIIDVFGDCEPWLTSWGIPSVRIEHATLLDQATLERLRDARMDFGIVSNLNFLFAEVGSYRRNLTDDQFSRCYPLGDLCRMMPAVALASDCPATTWADPDDPFYQMGAACTRRAWDGSDIGRDQAISPAQALMLFTGRARRLVAMPDLGRIVPGAEASFVVPDRDFLSGPIEDVAHARVHQTWVRGQLAWSSSISREAGVTSLAWRHERHAL
ncbi:MAG: amidohydrolase [Actinomycetaceae bacterium]|nr:amidohydrolase [Actinomycetaceae bacterium]MDU0970711.1 amidohydrolase [Actinomycetaceae bacterium]